MSKKERTSSVRQKGKKLIGSHNGSSGKYRGIKRYYERLRRRHERMAAKIHKDVVTILTEGILEEKEEPRNSYSPWYEEGQKEV
jgi:hypothetical protein